MRGEILDGHQMSGRKPKSADPKRLSSAQMRRTGTLEEWRNPAAAVQCRNRNTVGTEDPTGKATAESMSVTAKRRIEMSRRYRQSRRRELAHREGSRKANPDVGHRGNRHGNKLSAAARDGKKMPFEYADRRRRRRDGAEERRGGPGERRGGLDGGRDWAAGE